MKSLILFLLFSTNAFAYEYSKERIQNNWGELSVNDDRDHMSSDFLFEPYKNPGHILLLHTRGIMPVCAAKANIKNEIKIPRTTIHFNGSYPAHAPGWQAQVRGSEFDYTGSLHFYRACFYNLNSRNGEINLINDSLIVSMYVVGD